MDPSHSEEVEPPVAVAQCSTLKSAVQAVEACSDRIADAEATLQALLLKQATLIQAQRLLEHRALAAVLHEPLGFQNGRPTAALLVHRCLLHWAALSNSDAATQALLEALVRAISQEVDEEEVTSRIEGTMRLSSAGTDGESAGPQSPGSRPPLPLSSGTSTPNAHYAYWLTVLSTLLALVHRSVPPHPKHVQRFNGTKNVARVSSSGLPPSGAPQPGHAVASAAAAKFNDLKHSLAAFGKNLMKKAAPTQPPPHTAPPPSTAPAARTPSETHAQLQLGRTSSSGPQSSQSLEAASTNGAGRGELVGFTAPGSELQPGVGASAGAGGQSADAGGTPTPAQVFRKDLDIALQQCFVMCRDALKKHLSHILPACIHAPEHSSSFSPPSTPPPAVIGSGSSSQGPARPAPGTPAGVSAAEGAVQPAPLLAAAVASAAEVSAFGRLAEETRLAPTDPGARFTLDDDGEEEEEEPVVQGGAQTQGQTVSSAHAHRATSPPAATTAVAKAAAASGVQQQHQQEGAGEGGPEGAGSSSQDPVQQRAAEEAAAAEAARAAAMAPWAQLIAVLQEGLQALREGCVPRILIKCVFKQVLSFINVQLFNQLLLRPECCSASNARHVLRGLKMLDAWVMQGADDTLMRPLYLELRHVRQAATFLVAPKAQLTSEDISTQLCPALNNQQIYRLATTFWDDVGAQCVAAAATATATGGTELRSSGTGGEPGSEGATTPSAPAPASDMVSGEVLEALKASSRDGGGGVVGNGGLIVTCLLDDETQPIIAPQGCTAPEVLALVESKELYGPMLLPPQLNTEECPRSVFEFVEAELPVPSALLHAAKA